LGESKLTLEERREKEEGSLTKYWIEEFNDETNGKLSNWEEKT
jgi:hypothetical protein